MPFSRNQRGIVHLGILGIIVLAGGLFIASKLASNPDLTFFNIAEEAKNVNKDECSGCKDGALFYWDRKSDRCRKKTSSVCKAKAGVKVKTLCKKGSYCTGNIPGAIQCYLQATDTEPGWCCPPGQKDIGNGRCEAKSCDSGLYCYKDKGSEDEFNCFDKTGSDKWCCPGGSRLNPKIGRCVFRDFSFYRPVCGDSGCSDTKVWSQQEQCVSTDKPEGQWCCPKGTKLWASGECK